MGNPSPSSKLNQVKVNSCTHDEIKQIPAYAKFLKDKCTFQRKSKAHRSKKILLNKHVNLVLQLNTPLRQKDLGILAISSYIGDHRIERAQLDLGSTVNLIPCYVYESLGLGELQPSNCDGIPKVRIDDVLVKINKGFFLVDFVMLDMESIESYWQISIIRSCPFLATANDTIGCRSGMLDVGCTSFEYED